MKFFVGIIIIQIVFVYRVTMRLRGAPGEAEYILSSEMSNPWAPAASLRRSRSRLYAFKRTSA